MKPKLLFYCQHVLGMGHMARSREIVKGLADFDVVFINGGEPVEGFAFPESVRVVQLPPIRSDAEFRAIDASDGAKEERRRMLLDLLDETSPNVFVIEMFPFGRRKFAFELAPVLEEIDRRGRETRVVSSVRDILVSKRDQARHEEQACQLLNRHFDLVLVHSDPRFQRLEETFFRAGDLKCPIAYTGFVTESLASGNPQRRGNRPRVIASAGGGRVGFGLLSAVIDGSRLLAPALPHELLVYTGPYLSDDEFEQLLRSARDLPHCLVRRFAADFLAHVGAADLVVSMAGYNTCMNILTTGVRAIVVPFTGNQNEEQTIRARKLAALGLVEVLHPGELSPAAIAQAMQAALGRPMQRTAVSLDLNGVSNTARLLKEVTERTACHV